MIIGFVGDYGTGKTTEAKKRFLLKTKKKKRIIAPVQADFKDLPDFNKIKFHDTIELFVKEAVTLSDTCFVIDEAVCYIPKKQPDSTSGEHEKNLLTWMVNARKLNNLILFLYHDFTETPLWIFKTMDYLLRFRTNDQFNIQYQRFITFPNISKSFKGLNGENNLPNYDYDEIKIRG